MLPLRAGCDLANNASRSMAHAREGMINPSCGFAVLGKGNLSISENPDSFQFRLLLLNEGAGSLQRYREHQASPFYKMIHTQTLNVAVFMLYASFSIAAT